ncbi:MAG: class I SAM-dependent methyltransferase [Desulfovibrionaceae bacterium]|jgi:2-polyprenyl-6-hydroxyphenyl methylase/3-demethylubiquinone-9 3-methyltransferase|nr:class I SAM-dependent methyltransferase [Desulfovibrionaceae bacterium]
MSTRYAFGKNWADFSRKVQEARIAHATDRLAHLLPDIAGRTFLDIGSGSGLHSLAALRLGAARVLAIDLDEDSVATTRAMLEANAPGGPWRAERGDILGEHGVAEGYDIVYSWGVLHHTGAMWTAVENALALAKPGGRFCIALYLKTPFCGFWRHEKRLYSAHPLLRPLFFGLFTPLLLLRQLAGGVNPVAYVREYERQRGMRFTNDVADWLGGYPYESVSPREMADFAERHGLTLELEHNTTPPRGLFGSTCGEWVFRVPERAGAGQ